jgi:hypothetical protein
MNACGPSSHPKSGVWRVGRGDEPLNEWQRLGFMNCGSVPAGCAARRFSLTIH